jgi:hypothetical protein
MTYKQLLSILPALNHAWIEQTCGLGSGRIYDCRSGRSTLTNDELETIRGALTRLLPQPFKPDW